MNINRIMLYALISLLVLPVNASAAQDATGATDEQLLRRPQVQVFIENDKFAGSDRYYTNGFKVGIGSELPLLGDALMWLPERVIDFLEQPGPDGKQPRNHIGFALGQNLYTPRDIGVAANQPNDRPWAAWLYLGSIVQRVQGDRLDTVEFDLGFVGPAALGRQVQSGWHGLIGADKPRGWSNQIHNELAFMVAYLQKRRYGAKHVQFVPHAGVTLGTVLTLARAGGIVRVGQNMTGFGPDTIDPGGAMLQTTRAAVGEGEQDRLEWYVFTGLDYRLVARNIFLDGPAFGNGPNVNRRNAVHDLSAGFVMRYRNFNFSITRVFRSEEFTTAAGGGGRQGFSSINLGWQWD